MKKNIKFLAARSDEVSGIIRMPDNAEALYVFAHGAGAPMMHPFMGKAAELLADEGIGTLRYNFPYSEKKLRGIDSAPILLQTVRSAVNEAKKYTSGVPLFAGGKSMGGRMTSQAQASEPMEGVAGLVFFGFPLHAPGKESIERAEHLYKIKIPMLFLQGTRDKLANLELLKPVLKKTGKKAHLLILEGADHSFHMLKSSGRSDDDLLKETVKKCAEWMKSITKK